MDQLELIKLIEERKKHLEQELENESPEVDYCKQYVETYPTRNIDVILEMNLCDLFVTIYRSTNNKISFEDIYDFVLKNQYLIMEVNNRDTISKLFSELELLMDTGEFDKIQELQRDDNNVDRESEEFMLEYLTSVVFQAKIKKILDIDDDYDYDYDLTSLMEMYKQDGEEIFKAKDAIISINKLKIAMEEYELALRETEQELDKKFDKKTSDKIRSGYIEKFFNVKEKEMNQYIIDTAKYIDRVLADEKKRKKAIHKELINYDALERDLFIALEKGEVTDIEKIVEKAADESIRLNVLRLIYEHNSKIYSALQNEYNNLSASSSSHYKVLLTNYGISSDQYEVSTIMDKSLEELTTMLEKLNKIGITGPKILLKIAQNGDLDVVTYIESLLEKNILSKEFIIKNSNVFSTTSDELENLKTNIDFLKGKGINVHYLRASQEMFLLEPVQLEDSIKTLEDYDLINSMKTGIKCEFLQYKDLKAAIDTLLELGYEKNLEEKLELLNYKDNFQRLRLLKELNIPINSTEELMNVLSSDKFMMPDNEISSYIYNAVNYLQPNVEITEASPINLEQLEEYSKTKRTYSFDGILISKNKVKRNLSTVSEETPQDDKLIYGLVHESILSDEEFETITKLVRQSSSKVMKKTQVNE